MSAIYAKMMFLAAALAGAFSLWLYISSIGDRLERAKHELEASNELVSAYADAAKKMAEQARMLGESRDLADAEENARGAKIDASGDACLDQPLPPGLID